MPHTIQLGEIEVELTRKDVMNVHLSVHPPDGRVTLVAPKTTRLDVARAYAVTRLRWIREQQARLRGQLRETRREFVTRESHYVWGRRYLLLVVEHEAKPSVTLHHHRLTLTVRPGSTPDQREKVLQEWYRQLLHEAVPPLIRKWGRKLGVAVNGYFLQRMKTKWGSCNHHLGHIRLNTELIKKPRHLLEYVIVHEMVHLIEPTHSERFVSLVSEHYPAWREARAELNELPLASERWDP